MIIIAKDKGESFKGYRRCPRLSLHLVIVLNATALPRWAYYVNEYLACASYRFELNILDIAFARRFGITR